MDRTNHAAISTRCADCWAPLERGTPSRLTLAVQEVPDIVPASYVVVGHLVRRPRPPAIRFTGPVDRIVRDDLATDVVAVARELLSNAIRKAHCDLISIEVAAQHGTVWPIRGGLVRRRDHCPMDDTDRTASHPPLGRE